MDDLVTSPRSPFRRPCPVGALVRAAWPALLVLLCLLAGGRAAVAGEVSVRAHLATTTAYVGQPVQLQLEVEGADDVAAPTPPVVDGLEITPLGGQSNSSTQITIINGRTSKIVHRGYVYGFRVVPRRPGTYTIPAITVTVAGTEHRSQPLQLTVRPPGTHPDLALEVRPAKETAYVGEVVEVTVTWYVGREVEDFDLTLPVLDDDRFFVGFPPEPTGPAGPNQIALEIAGHRLLARKSRTTRHGREFLAVSFPLYLVPRQAGKLSLGQATVSAQLVSREVVDPFGRGFGFPDFSLLGRRRTETVVVGANSPALTVHPLPAEGRPPDFSGLVGSYSMAAEASPRQVSVGEPITLTVMVTGPPYLENVQLPDLAQQKKFSRRFKIPAEMAPGRVEGQKIVFTQTLRALDATVQEIPPVSLAVFDPAAGRYTRVATEPIPIEVRPARQVTAADALRSGAPAPAAGTAPPAEATAPLTATGTGIAANYEDADVLGRGPAASPHWLLLLATLLPGPLVAGGLAGGRAWRRHRAGRGPTPHQARRRFLRELQRAGDDPERLWQALQVFLASLTGREAGTITSGDSTGLVAKLGGADALATQLAELLQRCEAARFANRPLDAAWFRGRAEDLARQLAGAAERNATNNNNNGGRP